MKGKRRTVQDGMWQSTLSRRASLRVCWNKQVIVDAVRHDKSPAELREVPDGQRSSFRLCLESILPSNRSRASDTMPADAQMHQLTPAANENSSPVLPLPLSPEVRVSPTRRTWVSHSLDPHVRPSRDRGIVLFISNGRIKDVAV